MIHGWAESRSPFLGGFLTDGVKQRNFGSCRVSGVNPAEKGGDSDQRRRPRAVVPINDISRAFAAGLRLSCTKQGLSGSCCGTDRAQQQEPRADIRGRH